MNWHASSSLKYRIEAVTQSMLQIFGRELGRGDLYGS